MSQPFPYYIEDWLLWLAAKRTATGDEIDFPWYADIPINLANYDVSFIMRSSTAIEANIGLTEKQTKLAIKIVTKYQRQIWSKLNKNVLYLLDSPTPVTRLKVREVDKTCSVQLNDNHWYIIFPYDPPMVDQMHKLSAHGASTFLWQGKEKQWCISYNECNLRLICEFMETRMTEHMWDIDELTQQLLNEAHSIIKNKYRYIPHVDVVDNKPILVNSNEHIDAAWERVAGMDLYNTIFRADSMGLSISKNTQEQVLEFLPNLGPALLASQEQINFRSKTLYTFLKPDLIGEFSQLIKADNWVFISHNTSSSTGLLESTINIDTSGEKIFFSDKVPRMSYSYFSEIKQLTGDTIIFVDNLTVLDYVNRHLTPGFRVLKTFYSHGGNS